METVLRAVMLSRPVFAAPDYMVVVDAEGRLCLLRDMVAIAEVTAKYMTIRTEVCEDHEVGIQIPLPALEVLFDQLHIMKEAGR